MNNEFDHIARVVASGISRRTALRRMGAGVTGLLLTSLGIRKAKAIYPITFPADDPCQTCDLDTFTCGGTCGPGDNGGLPFNPRGDLDGAWVRLLDDLETKGFVVSANSNPVSIYRKGVLYWKANGVVMQHGTIAGQVAHLAILASPAGDTGSVAVVLNNGRPIYALTVDNSGRSVQTIATQTTGTEPSLARPGTSGASAKMKLRPELTTAQADSLCTYAGAVACGSLDLDLGWLLGEAACAAGATVPFGAIVPQCSLFVHSILAEGTKLCGANLPLECSCALNTQTCDGICCDPCHDCVNGVCVPAANAATCASGVCCGGQCCSTGAVCDAATSTCKSAS